MEDLIEKAIFKKEVEQKVNKCWYERDKQSPKYWKNKDTDKDGVIHTTAGVVKIVDNNIHMKPAQKRH